MQKNHIGFVGVGRMGSNMARRLHDRGFQIAAVYDTNSEVAMALADEFGSMACGKLCDVSARSEIIVTVVSDDHAMRAIFDAGSADSLLGRDAAKGKLFINCATVSPQIHHAVQSLAELAGAETLEACMASSITQAREGSLYLMCGGKHEAFVRAKDVLAALGSKVRYMGLAGEAAKVKALVNMVMNTSP